MICRTFSSPENVTMGRMLFLVNGLGLGNSTRCHAIIQKLKEAGAVVGVITSGNGLWYFEDCEDIDQLHSIEQFHYANKDGRISILKTLWAVPEFLQIAVQNEKKIQRVLDTFNPDVAVIDSVYTTKVLRQNRIPVIAINNADNVVSGMIRFRNFPWSVVLQFIFIEFFDYEFRRPKSHVCIVSSYSDFIIIVAVDNIDHTEFTFKLAAKRRVDCGKWCSFVVVILSMPEMRAIKI